MSVLADEVAKILAKRQKARRHILASQKVDETLIDLGIPTSFTKAVPVPLRLTRIHFRGTKQLNPTHPDAAGHKVQSVTDNQPVVVQHTLPFSEEEPLDDHRVTGDSGKASTVPVPFAFEWKPQAGVNGIASGRNLRGKSTVLNVLMWTLTGRCARFQPDIQRWIEHVEADWTVGAERLRVSFDAINGVATGKVEKLGDVGGPKKPVLLGTFDGDDFESVIGHLMMNRLRLESIPVWTDIKALVHAWPSYSSALVVRANQLDPIVGNEQTIAVRMMQMFVGTDWAPALAAASTIRRGMDAERAAASDKAKAAGDALEGNRLKTLERVNGLKSKVGSLPAKTPDVEATLQAAKLASELSRQVHELETELFAQSSLVETARQQLRAAKARVHTNYENILATKFFHRMRPTACPRCAAEVTAERRAAEPDKHECSVCSSDLDLDALQSDIIVASSVPSGVTSTLIAGAATLESSDTEVADEDEPVDEIEAAGAAVESAEAATATLVSKVEELRVERDQAAAKAEAGAAFLTEVDQRRILELDLARAEGALEALTDSSNPKSSDPVDPVQAAVAEATETVLKQWLKDGQDPLLKNISADIERLVGSFGAENLADIKLDGAANMRLTKGGEPTTFSGITEGEKLRVKIATAIALIRHGSVENIGRHPGLLILDSPAAEEMPDSDLATMIESLIGVTEEAEMQIFVATRNATPLVDLLPPANRIVADGDDYVW
jgi:hypothetical protein